MPRWNPNHALAKSFLEVLLSGGKRAGAWPKRSTGEWSCKRCHWSNFESRTKCRHCNAVRSRDNPLKDDDAKKGKNMKGHNTPSAPPPPSTATGPDAAQPDSPMGDAAAEPKQQPVRRPAPEVTASQAEERAAALEASAQVLRAAGLVEKAEEQEAEAAAHRKKADKLPDPGRRMDLLKAFLKRAEARVEKGAQRVLELETELANARASLTTLQQELDEGREKLSELREGLREDEDESPAEAAAESAMAGLQTQLDAVQQELRGVKAAQRAEAEAQRVRTGELASLGVSELRSRIEKCHGDHSEALRAGQWDAAAALAESMQTLTAALGQATELDSLGAVSSNVGQR